MTAAPLYKKITAALLLLVMLLTSFVQVTHSHNSKKVVAASIKKTAETHEQLTAAGTEVNCFACDYQLVKDADFYAAIDTALCTNYTINYAVIFTSCSITNFTPAAGNRGPPALV